MLSLAGRAGALAVGFVFAASAAVFGATSTSAEAATRADATGSTSRPALLPRADPSSPATIVTPDADGTLWLHWKSDDNAHLDGLEHTFIYAQRLSRDGLHFVGQRSAILTADRGWEGRIVEAPHMVRAAGRYWLFYSGNWFNQPLYA